MFFLPFNKKETVLFERECSLKILLVDGTQTWLIIKINIRTVNRIVINHFGICVRSFISG